VPEDEPPNDSPDAKVRAWLRREGYPLEYEAARILRGAGFRTIQGWSYRGEDERGTAKPREVDVLASWEGGGPDDDEPTRRIRSRFFIAVETKYQTAPWVVLTTSHPPEWKPLATQMMWSFMGQLGISPQEAFPLGPEVGFSLKVVKERPKDPDAAFEALMQATNAATAVLDPGPTRGPQAEWALPVVVVRGGLFALGYTDEGVERLYEVPWCRMVWHGAARFDSPTVVDVVTIGFWPTHVRDLKEAAGRIVSRVDAFRRKALADNLAKQTEKQERAEAQKAAGLPSRADPEVLS
jgi:hypothetical protein